MAITLEIDTDRDPSIQITICYFIFLAKYFFYFHEIYFLKRMKQEEFEIEQWQDWQARRIQWQQWLQRRDDLRGGAVRISLQILGRRNITLRVLVYNLHEYSIITGLPLLLADLEVNWSLLTFSILERTFLPHII